MERQLPAFDQAYAALITRSRPPGMLDKTHGHGLLRVRPFAEDQQGRRPRPLAARLLVAFAGGGFKRGYIHGASDSTGSEPDHDPLTVENMAATVYNQLGIGPEKKLMSPGGRPQAIVNGQVVNDLLA